MTQSEIIQLVLFIAIMLLLLVSQILINVTYNKYALKSTNKEVTGEDIVVQMLTKNDVRDVQLGYTKGVLDDHYNSSKKVINLSKASYETNSIAAIAVAAHETGHAIQDHEGYFMLRLRKLFAPICIVSSKLVWVAIFAGIILQMLNLILIGFILMGITIVFQLITLPVEFNASRRAIQYLETCAYDEETMIGIKKMLKAAAFTYVASALASLLQLLRLVLGVSRRD